jgi:hypothetical protein
MGKENEERTSPQSYGLDRIQTSTLDWHKGQIQHNDKLSRGSRQSSPHRRLQDAMHFRHTLKCHQRIATTTCDLWWLWTVQSSRGTTDKPSEYANAALSQFGESKQET